MNLYMTSGTADYMEKQVEKYSTEQLIILHGNGNSVLIHETEKKSIFSAPRKFDVLDATGKLEQKGYYVFHNMPIVSDDRPVFEKKILDHVGSLKQDSSLISYRFLRPVKAETYILVTQWSGPASYEVWKNSSDYKNHLAPLLNSSQSSIQTIFNAATHITTYSAPPTE